MLLLHVTLLDWLVLCFTVQAGVPTVFAACYPTGYETTANTLTFTLFCVSTHPEAEARILQEIKAAPRPFYSADLEQQVMIETAAIG